MPRIFKGSEATLSLLIHNCTNQGVISELKFTLYTDDPIEAIDITDGFIIEGNIAKVTLPVGVTYAWNDGVINYIAQGMIDDDTFVTERQSNYYLKTVSGNEKMTIAKAKEQTTGSYVTIQATIANKTESHNYFNLVDETGLITGQIYGQELENIQVGNKYEIYGRLIRYNIEQWVLGQCVIKSKIKENVYPLIPTEPLEITMDNINSNAYIHLKGIIQSIGNPSMLVNVTISEDTNIDVRLYKGSLDIDSYEVGEEIEVWGLTTIPGTIMCTQIKKVEETTTTTTTYLTLQEVYDSADEYVEGFAAYVVDTFYNTPADIDGSKNCYVILTDETRMMIGKQVKSADFTKYNKGDRYVFSAEKSSNNYLNYLRPIELLSTNNYITMPKDAIEATSETYSDIPYGTYLYYEGEIISINSYSCQIVLEGRTLITRFGKAEWPDEFAVGDKVRVYGFKDAGAYTLVTDVFKIGTEVNLETQSVEYTENGTYSITPNEGYEGLSQVDINVNVNVTSKLGDLKENIDTDIFERYASNDGYDGYSYVYLDATDYGLSKYNEGYSAGKAEGGDCPELTSIDITKNGSYEGAFSLVNVNVPQEGGSCNLGQLNIEWDSNWKYNYFSATNDGYDGYNYVEINAENALNEKFNQGRDSIINTLTTLDVTENGTYTHPTVPVLMFDGDDMFDFAYADTVNAIEFKIKVDGGGWIFGDNTAGIYARSTNTLEIYWFGYETITTEFNEDEYNTFLLKPYDSENRLVINGIDRSDLLTEREWSTDTIQFNLGGNGHFNFVYAKFWSDYHQYNYGDKPLFYTIPNTDGNAKTSTFSGDFEVKTNIGGGSCQYTEEQFNFGYSSVNVNVKCICPSVQEQVNDYYYCPLILGDTGFGEVAKSWDTDMVTFNDSDGNIIEDKLYIPTYGNRNEFRTKTKAKFIQTLRNTSAIGTIEFGGGVEYIVMNTPSDFTNLTKLIIGEDMNTANFGTSTFPIIKEIWSYSTTSEIDVYFSLGSTFNSSGTLYLKNKDHETEWKNSLPSDWTIVYI